MLRNKFRAHQPLAMCNIAKLSGGLLRPLSTIVTSSTPRSLLPKTSSASGSTIISMYPPSLLSSYTKSARIPLGPRFYSSTKLSAKEDDKKEETNTNENAVETKGNEEIKEEDIDEVEDTGKEGGKSDRKDLLYVDPDEYDDYYEPPRTAGEYVAFYATLFARLLFIGCVAAGAFLTIRELLPSRLSPQTLFSECFDLLRNNDEVTRITGPDPTGYGRDTGSDARRNHVDSRQYTDLVDGSKRSRIRFNIKGRKGHVMVWAEVSDQMASNEFVYLIIQCRRTGRVVTIQDNRERLAAEAQAKKTDMPDSAPGMDDALKKLLGYGGKP